MRGMKGLPTGVRAFAVSLSLLVAAGGVWGVKAQEPTAAEREFVRALDGAMNDAAHGEAARSAIRRQLAGGRLLHDSVLARLVAVDRALGDLEGLERDARDILRLDPHNAIAHAALGEVRLEAFDFADAERHLRRAIDSGHPPSAACCNLAIALGAMAFEQGAPVAEAEAFARKAVERQPKNWRFLNVLAAILLRAGQTNEGEAIQARARAAASDVGVDLALVPPVFAPPGLTVSLLVVDPGADVFTCVGHAALRVEDLGSRTDLIYTYESEFATNRAASVFFGRLKMGMYVLPSALYLEDYKRVGRGVRQYRLGLPFGVLLRLRKILDRWARNGISVPYDYVRGGCARKVLDCILEAVDGRKTEVSDCPELRGRTVRDRFAAGFPVKTRPWQGFFLQSSVGTDVDRVRSPCEVVTTPQDLLLLLQSMKVDGHPVVGDGEKELLPSLCTESAPPFLTPLKVAWALAALALICVFCRRRAARASACLGWFLLSVQTALGVFFTYLIFLSDLPGTNGHWLIVPFNPLPLVFWKWRRSWSPWFAALLIAWICVTLLCPHNLTDSSYVVLAAGYALLFFGWV